MEGGGGGRQGHLRDLRGHMSPDHHTQRARGVGPMLGYCWAGVVSDRLTLCQRPVYAVYAVYHKHLWRYIRLHK